MQPYWLTGHKTPSYLPPTSVNINKMKNTSEKSRHNFNFGGTNHCLALTPLSLPFSNAKKEKKKGEKEILEEEKRRKRKRWRWRQRSWDVGGGRRRWFYNWWCICPSTNLQSSQLLLVTTCQVWTLFVIISVEFVQCFVHHHTALGLIGSLQVTQLLQVSIMKPLISWCAENQHAVLTVETTTQTKGIFLNFSNPSKAQVKVCG